MGILHSIKVPPNLIDPKKKVPIIFTGMFIDGYPFPRLIDIGLKALHMDSQGKHLQIDPLNDENEGLPTV